MMDPLNLIILAIAVFVIWRLYGVLGTRNGNERPPFDPFGSRTGQAEAPTATVPRSLPRGDEEAAAQPAEEQREPAWKGFASEGSPLGLALVSISQADRNFSPKAFLEGAKLAYEMIVEAFAKGDKVALKPLLNRDVYDGFAKEVDNRAARGDVMNTGFVGFQKAELLAAELTGNRAAITVRLLAEMITTTTSKTGELLDGDPKKVREVTDIWTFERDVTAKDPNWRLSSTEEPA
jgi:predicted lipid-binding transport protein (Tim44 family)